MQDFVGTFLFVLGHDRRHITITISSPVKRNGSYWCDVSAAGILERDVHIAGEDERQVRALSFGFINRRVAALGGELVDDDGSRVIFDESYDLP